MRLVLVNSLILCLLESISGLDPRALFVTALSAQQIVPDLMDMSPPYWINITYPSGVNVSLGNELPPTLVKDEPQTIVWPTEPNALYSLCLLDPDAPKWGEPIYRSFKHWHVINIPGIQVTAGQTLAAYVGPGPARGQPPNRYVFVVHKQPTKLESKDKSVDNRTIDGRKSFNIRDYAKQYNLGEVFATNFFISLYDKHSDQIAKQLSA